MSADFQGFPKDALAFLAELRENNRRDWFDAHKKRYERSVLAPAKAFVDSMGLRLKGLSPNIQAQARVNGSLFRLHRDVRFSNDKTPFKTHVGILFWEGASRMDSSCFYVHLEADSFMLACGMHEMDKQRLAEYRTAVADDERGKRLQELCARLRGQGYELGGLHYKRVPQGYDKAHPRAELLRHLGIWTGYTSTQVGRLLQADFLDFAMPHFKAMFPLHQWLLEMPTVG
ncbi:MAG: DUF2461 domain-containing protein [Myxococcota bacterium]|jgi:uncharacterized protein (TIGR02453 family)|nr:DUF2461 domain-containing protein [Myxococcota bacterium]